MQDTLKQQAAPDKRSHDKIVTVPARLLRIHPTAQRDLSPARVQKLAREMNLDAIGTLHAVEYEINGIKGIWIIDGQHRLEALTKLQLQDWEVVVHIHSAVKDDAKASELFIKLQDRLSMNAWARFKNAFQAGEAFALDIVRIAEQNGLKVEQHGQQAGTLVCVSTLTKVWKRDNGVTLEAVINILTAAWGQRDINAVDGRLIDGMAEMVAKHSQDIDRKHLIARLAGYAGGPDKLLRDSRHWLEFSGNRVGRSVYMQLVQIYNNKHRQKLEMLKV